MSVESLLARFAADRDRFEAERAEALDRAYRLEIERDAERLNVLHLKAEVDRLRALLDEWAIELGHGSQR